MNNLGNGFLLTTTTNPITSSFQGSFVQFELQCNSGRSLSFFTVLSPLCGVCLCVCVTPFSPALIYTLWGSSSQVQLRPRSVAAVCACVKWHPSLAEPHLTTQQLSQRISIQPATLQEPLSKRPLLFCCPPCLFLQMKGQLHHVTNKLPPVWVCQFASDQVCKQSHKADFYL